MSGAGDSTFDNGAEVNTETVLATGWKEETGAEEEDVALLTEPAVPPA